MAAAVLVLVLVLLVLVLLLVLGRNLIEEIWGVPLLEVLQ